MRDLSASGRKLVELCKWGIKSESAETHMFVHIAHLPRSMVWLDSAVIVCPEVSFQSFCKECALELALIVVVGMVRGFNYQRVQLGILSAEL